jgi:hypothetical protein
MFMMASPGDVVMKGWRKIGVRAPSPSVNFKLMQKYEVGLI